MHDTVAFRQMKDCTQQDCRLLDRFERDYVSALPDRVIAALMRLEVGLGGYPLTRLAHSLQTATRALRGGADPELIVAALVHDVGDEAAPHNHAELAAAMLRPYVRPEVTWIVEQHGLFQSYYYAHHYGRDRNARERFRDHPWFDACAAFCESWDQASFDPHYPAEPLDRFVPLVREVFGRAPFDARYVGAARPAQ